MKKVILQLPEAGTSLKRGLRRQPGLNSRQGTDCRPEPSPANYILIIDKNRELIGD